MSKKITRWPRIELFKGRDKQWYWRLRAGNGRIVAIGGEGYTRKSSASRAVGKIIGEYIIALAIHESPEAPELVAELNRIAAMPAVK